jgi:hypothetical protein
VIPVLLIAVRAYPCTFVREAAASAAAHRSEIPDPYARGVDQEKSLQLTEIYR